MSDLTDSDITKPTIGRLELNERKLIKTVRLTLNLIANIFMSLTVFISLLYACGSYKITAFQLHVVLCVLGYQLFMCQGILVISKYNSWSMYLTRSNRKNLHFLFQLLCFVLVVVGSSIIMNKESHHFNSTHGTLGIISLVMVIISTLNGTLANYIHKLNRTYIISVKFIHYASGVLTLFVSSAALSTGFEELSFRIWVKNDNAVAGLIFITWVFTLLVSLEFWLLTGQRLRNLLRYS